MPRYLVQTRKATQEFGGRKWSNRYFLLADTMNEALDAAQTIWQTGERIFHYTDVYCYEVYANLVGDTPFTPGQTKPIDGSIASGVRTIAGNGEILPTFVVARVDFTVAGSRPSRKFYRPHLREGDVTGDQLTGGILTAITTGINAISSGFIIDEDGDQWSPQNGVIKGVTSRRLGRDSFINVPPPPVVEP